jgi:hypothetical protein
MHWDLIDADLHQVYGLDSASEAFNERPWRWFQRRVLGLLTCESRIQRKLAPPEPTPAVPSIPKA